MENIVMKSLLKTSRVFFSLAIKNWPVLLIIAVVSVFFWKVFILGFIPLPGDFVVGVYYPWLDYHWGYSVGVPVKNPITTDVISLIYPEQMLAIDMMKSGQLPLWNPYILAGTPLFANLQAAPFSPTNFVYLLGDKLTAWSIQIILQHFLTGFFMFLLLRRWKVSEFASVLGSVVFAFSGFNMIFSQWNGHTLSSAFIPLSILLTDKLFKEESFSSLVGLSIVLVLQLFSGYPQTSLYTVAAIGVYWLVLSFFSRKNLIRKSFLLIASGMFALGLAAIQLLPAVELWKLSQRGFEPHPFEWAFLPWEKVITIVAPDFFGNHATANYWGPQDYTSNTAYIGVISLTFSLLALNLIRKNRNILYLFLISFFSLIMSFPTPLSVFLWNENILGMRAASAHRITVIFTFSASALAAYGAEYFIKTKNLKIKLTLIVIWMLIGGFFLFSLYLYMGTFGSEQFYLRGIPKYKVAIRNLILPQMLLLFTTFSLLISQRFRFLRRAVLVVLFVLMVFEFYRFGWKFTPFTPRRLAYPNTPVLEYLMSQEGPSRITGNSVIPVNIRTPYKLQSLEGYETIHPLRISQFLAALNSNKSGAQPLGRFGMVDNDTSRLLELTNTKYHLALKRDLKGNPDVNGQIGSKFTPDRFKVVFEDRSTSVLENVRALPRGFMVYEWEIIDDGQKIINALLDLDYPFESKIILESPIKMEQFIGDAPRNEVKFIYYREQESLIAINTKEEGLLFVSDAYFPGWKAYLDNKEVDVYRADFAFRAVRVPSGNHFVRFVYRPNSFLIGAGISAATLIGLLLSPVAARLLRRYTKAEI
ncbi:MAG: hypothetical protein UV74_C0013G0381 [Candidatus Woesebacteria bacterium GW2011_GWB1_43_14]|uniref:Bacterial membrane protein YfhO n=1 Tax=Candidatus Woesebacteria bacterium GW2011_GWB1_43_14 TaxID=1618578 RepID=A0A0G1DHU1_9BACT|nr:MAG: hypothetical protein UV51_C0001G0039 [Candidatus Woesebacteria bacterium GW2011_GWC1_42_9]KKS97259.1 MAG: hypothetical protein UV74_C0013G0381 [Candidatus Woesebacteria bacterium GW2011_GWB1_43_14]